MPVIPARCRSPRPGAGHPGQVPVTRARCRHPGAKTLHPVESRYGKISQESFNLSSDRSSSNKNNTALFSAFNSSLSLKFEPRQTSRREHQSQIAYRCLCCSSSLSQQFGMQPTSSVHLCAYSVGKKKHEAKNTLCSLPNRIVSTAPKLKQTENIQMSLLRFGLILNTILGFRIQTFSVPRRGNGSQIHLSSKK